MNKPVLVVKNRENYIAGAGDQKQYAYGVRLIGWLLARMYCRL
mgnify:CR=1 FL=1